MLSEKQLTGRGLIPAEPIRNMMARWCIENTDFRALAGPRSVFLSHVGQLIELTGLSEDFIVDLMADRKQAIGFDNADKIVCGLYGALEWHLDPDLEDVYQGFDFSALDRKKPTTREAA